ncbi:MULTISPECIES: hypothetical protein [unclassified Roseovarius]|uniref:hypothetical protein n=1 Tax=unclassified Roseovarius TaxID=2614913 RepID=UPI00273E4C4C|nr:MULTISPECIES: hypothetical protein [unclassified Roseovarius]
MGTFEISGPNGKTYQVEGATADGAARAFAAFLRSESQSTPNPPEGMFRNPSTGQLTSRELLKGVQEPSTLDAISGGAMQGFSFGTTDELMGAIGHLEGGEDMATFRREQARAMLEAQSEQRPGAYIAGNVAGAVTNPAARLVAPVNTIKGAAATGGAFAAAQGFGEGEGNATNRAKEALVTAPVGLFAGGAIATAVKGAGAGARGVSRKLRKNTSIADLKLEKNRAYAAVKQAGVKFDQNDMIALSQRAHRKAKLSDVDFEADPQSAAVLRMFKRRAGEKSISLNRLDRVRQTLWARYNRGDEPFVLDMIGEIDGMIASKAQSSSLMKTAREAHARFSKAQLLDNSFKKARRHAAASGSGGNVVNAYRQAVNRILDKPHEAKWFTADEIAIMERFVMGSNAENTLRKASKLSPNGNGLMLALNIYASTISPAMLGAGAVAEGAKRAADRGVRKGAEDLIESVGSGIIPTLRTAPTGAAAVGAGIAASESLRQQKR